MFPLIAPFQLLLRTAWTTYLHPFFALAAIISLGAMALSAFLFFAAVAGLDSALVFDRRTRTRVAVGPSRGERVSWLHTSLGLGCGMRSGSVG